MLPLTAYHIEAAHMKPRQEQVKTKIADIHALMTLIDTGKDAQGHRVIVNGAMMGEVLDQHYRELGRLVYLEASGQDSR